MSKSIICGSIVASNDIYQLERVNLFPNPVYDQLTIEWDNPTLGSLSIIVFNLHGKKLLESKERITQSGQFIKELNLNGITAGTYYIKLVQNDRYFVQKIKVIK